MTIVNGECEVVRRTIHKFSARPLALDSRFVNIDSMRCGSKRFVKAIGDATSGSMLALGTWHGIYLYEHRLRGQRRQVVLHLIGD